MEGCERVKPLSPEGESSNQFLSEKKNSDEFLIEKQNQNFITFFLTLKFSVLTSTK